MTPTPKALPVFYSWQAELPNRTNRGLIESALVLAVEQLRGMGDTYAGVVLDQDTQGEPGSPKVLETILEKIARAACFVADLSIVTKDTGARPAPNANVVFELGFAVRELRLNRILLVMNTVFGEPRDLPFDLGGMRVLRYSSSVDGQSRADCQRGLGVSLQKGIANVLRLAQPQPDRRPMGMRLSYVTVRRDESRHDYALRVEIQNDTTSVLAHFHVDLEFPTALLENPGSNSALVAKRSNATTTLFRVSDSELGNDFYPGDIEVPLQVSYHFDHGLYRAMNSGTEFRVRATAYVEGYDPYSEELSSEQLQNF